MKIVSFKICPFVQRVTALLATKNIKYQIVYINLNNKPDWFLRASPNGQVPILITERDEVLFESDAIVEYIEETSSPALFSENHVTKAQQRAWSYLAAKNYLVQCSTQRSKDEQTLTERKNKLNTAWAKLEKQLSTTKFFDGNVAGMVDIAWLPLLHRAEIIKKHAGYDFIKGFAKVQQLQKNIMASGLVEKSVARDFEDKFINFYLSADTYLGQLRKIKIGSSCCGESECTDADFRCCS